MVRRSRIRDNRGIRVTGLYMEDVGLQDAVSAVSGGITPVGHLQDPALNIAGILSNEVVDVVPPDAQADPRPRIGPDGPETSQ